MEFRNLKTFLRIAELQSFTKAAAQLGYSQSAVTMQIKQLEEELGIRLFDRIGKDIKLTDKGKEFTHHAADILKSVQDAKSSINKTDEIYERGILRIGIAESLLTNILPKVLTKFQEKCPKVETVIKTPLNQEMFNMLQTNEVDIIYFIDKLVYQSEWVKIFEHREKAHFIAPAGHALSKKQKVSLEEILSEPMILTEQGVSYRYELEQTLAKQGYELHPVLEAGNTDLIIDMLLNNGGISFLPFYAIEKYINNGKLAIIKNNDVHMEMWSQMVYHRKKWLTPQMQVFMDLMKEAENQRKFI